MVLAVDYNQSLSVPETLMRVRVLDEEGLEWIEEPMAPTTSPGTPRWPERCTPPFVQVKTGRVRTTWRRAWRRRL